MRPTRFLLPLLRAALGLFATLALAAAAPAQEKTPSHVYQAVGLLEQKVRLIMEADFAEIGAVAAPRAEARRPRHVYAKLVEIGGKIAMLRRLNGLGAEDILTMPAKAIAPGDVFGGLQKIGGSIDALISAYGLAPPRELEPLQQGKTPGDVYARLSLVSQLLDRTYIPATVPNDVYRIAETALREAGLLAGALGAHETVSPMRRRNKTPADVLKAVRRLSATLGEVAAAHAEAAPSGGVFAPKEATGKVTPADVRDALNLAVADLLEMRVKAGAGAAFELPPPPVGRTPSDVFSRVEEARALLASAARS